MSEQRPHFLRAIPIVIDATQRIAIEAIGYAEVAIQLAINRMRQIGSSFEPPGSDLSFNDRAALFSDTWAIVDHAHMLRMLLHEISDKISVPAFEDFRNQSEVATRLRNKRDHLHNNIANLAAEKGRPPPLHGALSFSVNRLRPEAVQKIGRGEQPQPGDFASSFIVCLTIGTLHRDQQQMRLVNPLGRRIEFPVGAFQLQAFDSTIDLSAIAMAASNVASAFDTEIRSEVEARAAEVADLNGVDVTELLKPQATTLTVVVHTQYTT